MFLSVWYNVGMNTLYAWTAGLLDGEGSFAIKRSVRKDTYLCNYQVWLVCGMSDIEPNRVALERLHKTFGGNITIRKAKPELNRRGVITWTAVSQVALRCLKLIYPYLVVKKEQARLLVEFQETCKSRTGVKKDLAKKLKQEEYFYELRKLNFKNKLYLQRLSEETPNKMEKRQSELPQ